MNKWIGLIIGTIVFFLINLLFDFIFNNSIELVKTTTATFVWIVLWIIFYMTKIIRFK